MNTILNTSLADRVLPLSKTPASADEVFESTERAETYLAWVETVLQFAKESVTSFAVLFGVLYFLGVVAMSVAVLFYTFCR
jgi:hypothetical protein